ncbi:MAG TPA: glycosyltransferase [Chryseolinea sp.]
MAKILYIGDRFATSGHRAAAIKRLGHTVDVRDPYQQFDKMLRSWRGALHYRTGYTFLQSGMVKWIESLIAEPSIRPDAIWVDSGELVGPACLKVLKELKCPVLLYNVDDPTGKRDGNRFNSLIKSIPYYDLIVLVRKETAEECEKLGGKRVMRVFRSYDEVEHKPFASDQDIPAAFKSDVAFIGTWMRYEKRDEFLLELVAKGVPISIWGDRWEKSPHFAKLKSFWRGKALRGRDYVAAIQGSKICLGMLSKGNRDLHTQRSLEVPYAGGLFCAERTSEHLELYKEGTEAVFWSDAAECADICNKLLNDSTLREKIKTAGMERIRALKLGNEDVIRQILGTIMEKPSAVTTKVNPGS